MVHNLTIHLASVLLVGALCDWLYSRWVRLDSVPERCAVFVGVGLGLGRIAWLLLPLWNWLRPVPLPVVGRLRAAEYWWSWILLVLLGVGVIWGLLRTWWALKLLEVLQVDAPGHGVHHRIGTTEFFTEEATRQHLQREYREFTGIQDLVVRLSFQTELPVLIGAFPPVLVVPKVLVNEGRDEHLESLLDTQAGHLQMGHHWLYLPLAWLARLLAPMTPLAGAVGWAMNTRVDRGVFQKGPAAWGAYEQALGEVLPGREEWSPAVALPHHTKEAVPRLEQAKMNPRRRGFGYVFGIVFVFLGGTGLSAAVGRVSLHSIKEFLMHREASGFQARIFDPRVSLMGIPGEGGVVADGAVVDARQGSGDHEVSSLQVHMRDQLPKGEAARISFDFVVSRGPGVAPESGPPMVSSRTMECRFNEDTGVREFWVFDFRSAPLPEGKGTITLGVRLANPKRHLGGSEDRHYGPDFAVPAGWRLEIRNFRVEECSSAEVSPSSFPDDGSSFVEWYRKHERGSAICLKW